MTQEERVLDIRANFVASIFGHGIRSGVSYAVTCPKCCSEESRRKKKKLSIRLDTGMHHCWICGLKGKTLLYTVKRFHPTRIDEYARIFEEKEYQSKLTVEEDQEEVLTLPEGFVPLSEIYRSRDPDVRDVVNYLHLRGLDLSDFYKWRLGTCLGGRFCRRVIMPSFDAAGDVNYYTARSIDFGTSKKFIDG